MRRTGRVNPDAAPLRAALASGRRRSAQVSPAATPSSAPPVRGGPACTVVPARLSRHAPSRRLDDRGDRASTKQPCRRSIVPTAIRRPLSHTAEIIEFRAARQPAFDAACDRCRRASLRRAGAGRNHGRRRHLVVGALPHSLRRGAAASRDARQRAEGAAIRFDRDTVAGDGARRSYAVRNPPDRRISAGGDGRQGTGGVPAWLAGTWRAAARCRAAGAGACHRRTDRFRCPGTCPRWISPRRRERRRGNHRRARRASSGSKLGARGARQRNRRRSRSRCRRSSGPAPRARCQHPFTDRRRFPPSALRRLPSVRS